MSQKLSIAEIRRSLKTKDLKQTITEMQNRQFQIRDKQLLQIAFAQEVATTVCFDDEEVGSRKYAALEKAIKNIEANNTIRFGDGVLSFVSKNSGKRRVVTAAGCSDFCDCKNRESYHQETFAILDRYIRLGGKVETKFAPVTEQNRAPYFPQTLNVSKREKIGGVFI